MLMVGRHDCFSRRLLASFSGVFQCGAPFCMPFLSVPALSHTWILGATYPSDFRMQKGATPNPPDGTTIHASYSTGPATNPLSFSLSIEQTTALSFSRYQSIALSSCRIVCVWGGWRLLNGPSMSAACLASRMGGRRNDK